MALRLSKPYELQTCKGLLVALEPPVLGLSVVKAVVLSGLEVVQGKVHQKKLPDVAAQAVLRDYFYATTRSALQTIAAADLNRRLAHKLMKDVKESALRKMARYGNKATVATRIFKTAGVACFLQYLAIFLVEEAALLVRQSKQGKTKDEKRAEFRRETRKQLLAMLANMLGTSLGASVGSLVKPGQGTFVGGMVGAVLADLIPVDQIERALSGKR